MDWQRQLAYAAYACVCACLSVCTCRALVQHCPVWRPLGDRVSSYHPFSSLFISVGVLATTAGPCSLSISPLRFFSSPARAIPAADIITLAEVRRIVGGCSIAMEFEREMRDQRQILAEDNENILHSARERDEYTLLLMAAPHFKLKTD